MSAPGPGIKSDIAACPFRANNGHRGLAHEPLGCHRKVVLHWGGTRWGISPTVAQIHAQLYSRSALSAEEIADALSVARCKVSTSLKEL
jgi:hypothetical protein